MRATLILTTNQEPPDDLVRDTQAAGRARGLDIDIWSVSRTKGFRSGTEVRIATVADILNCRRAAQLLVERAFNEVVSDVNEVRDQHWKNADAVEPEKIVRKACGWRVIGRVAGASAPVGGAFVATFSTLGFACCLAAWRMLKPIKQEMRDALAFRSTGAPDETR